MAITVTNQTADNDITQGFTGTTASISPTANTILIATCWNQPVTGGPAEPTISDSFSPNLTWTRINGTSEHEDRIVSWWAPTGSTPGSGTITFTVVTIEAYNFSWIVDQISSADNSAPIVQSVADTGGDQPRRGRLDDA